ncbi:IS3 family transposase [Streptomyces durmitorensis]|uniref:IS3 family transposase n=1 Tax=Streptomyces durmitorensis TaxID=319947 RepID=A0ABY4PP89_9ACTN|nr:IS3 family transposase [Streptomyces durmitorensis]UQT54927.1 IS3 family transposase [Streptomyces durmitorensis]
MAPQAVRADKTRDQTRRAGRADPLLLRSLRPDDGSPRITLDLWEEGWQMSHNTVAEIMAELGLQGRKPPRRRRSLTRPGKRTTATDLVRRKFDAIAPNVLWWGDMTEIETGEGKLYLASVHDAFSRRALGYAMGARHDAALVGAALQMAIATRGGQVGGVIFHTDRGSGYTSEAFQQLCGRWGVVQSVGRVGSALDNAAAESFHSVLKVEYIHRHTFATCTEARLKTATWIADFYNTKRRHSVAAGKPPSSSNGSSRKRERGPTRKAGPHNQRLYGTRGLTTMVRYYSASPHRTKS